MVAISCIVNAHKEAHLVYPALQSVQRSREFAEEFGITTELIVTLDDPDSLTREIVIEQTRDIGRVLTVSFCELASSRNYAISKCNGRYSTFLDGDDIWCRSWLVDSYLLAQEYADDCIIHPEFNAYFGGKREYIMKHIDMDSDEFSAEFILDKNYWTALCFTKTSVFKNLKYKENRLSKGFGYEDWTWNWETLQKKIHHKVAPGTAHYIRRGKNYSSLLEVTNSSGAIPSIYNVYNNLNTKSSKNRKLTNNGEANIAEKSFDPIKGVVHQSDIGIWEIRNSKLIGKFDSAIRKKYDVSILINGDLVDKKVIHTSAVPGVCFSEKLDRLENNSVYRIGVIVSESENNTRNFEILYCPLIERYRKQISEIFYADFYASKYVVSSRGSEKNSLNNFMNVGLYLDRMPNPWFAPKYYRKRYGDLLENIEIPLLSFLEFESQGNVNPCNHLDMGFYQRSISFDSDSAFSHYVNVGHRAKLLAKKLVMPLSLESETIELSKIEKKLIGYKLSEKNLVTYPYLDRLSHTPELVMQQYGMSIECIICIDCVMKIDRMVSSCIQTLQERFGSEKVLICVTEGKEKDLDQYIKINSEVIFLDKEYLAPFANIQRRAWVLHTIIASLCPGRVIIFNSNSAWVMVSRFGQQLHKVTRLICGIPSSELHLYCEKNRQIAKYFIECVNWFDLFILDNDKAIAQILAVWGARLLGINKFHCIEPPSAKTASETPTF